MYYNDAERLYNKAIEEKNEKILMEFGKYGKDKHHMIENYAVYTQFLACGYKDAPKYNEYGWCMNEVPKSSKQHLILWGDQYHNSFLEFAQLPNGKWVYGYDYMLSESGACGGCSIFSTQFNSKNEAINAGLKQVEKSIKSSSKAVDLDKLPSIQKLKVNLSWPSLF